MSKAVLISVKPKWCELIADGEKTIEVRKTKPKLKPPFKCYIYCTKSTQSDQLWVLSKNERKENFGLSAVCANLNATAEICRGNGKVIGEFVCDDIETLHSNTIFNAPALYSQSCMTREEYFEYSADNTVYLWHISKLETYDTPKELGNFTGLRETRFGAEPVEIMRPPQSWCYVEEVKR